MTKTLVNKIIIPTVGIILMAALVVAWSYSWVQERHWENDALHNVEIFQANLIDLLALTNDQLTSRMNSEMEVLRSKARRLGMGTKGRMLRVGSRNVRTFFSARYPRQGSSLWWNP